MDIDGNLVKIRETIESTALSTGRDPKNIELLAVSKTVSPDIIREVYRKGQRSFGENRVQEWREKVDLLPDDCKWHLIGRLQTNKVKYLDARVLLIHSLDRYELLQKLEEQGKRIDHVFTTLIQINVADDENKAGLKPEELKDFLGEVGVHPHVRVNGLMTIGKLHADREETRGYFRQLRELRDQYRGLNFPGVMLEHLSMGMSNDFDLAIEEGATIVRIGRQIFGER